MDCSFNVLGSGLLAELKATDKLTQIEAAAWISRKAGRAYDPGAMYQLLWSDQEDAKTWGGYADLRVRMMSDFELNDLERAYRKNNHMPPRRPWEPRMYESSMGRADR